MVDVLIDPSTGETIDKPPVPIMPETAWPTGFLHVSHSELAHWLECSYRHKLAYIDRVVIPSLMTPHPGFGTGLHASCEKYIQTRTMDKEIAFSEIRKSWEENRKLFTEGPFPDWSPKGYKTEDDWIKMAERILDEVPAFLDKEFPGWEPFGVEEKLYESIDGKQIKFKGYIDGILKVKDARGKQKYQIIDWKTCGWGWRKEKKEDFKVLLQLILYKHYFAQKHNVPIRDIRCGFCLMKRDGKPGKSLELFQVPVGPSPISRGLQVINNFAKSVERRVAIKNRESCRFCQYNNTVHCLPDL